MRGYTADYMREFERELISKHSFLYVYMKASLSVILDRVQKRGEDFVKNDQFVPIIGNFENYMDEMALPYIEIDTTNSDPIDDVNRVLIAQENSSKIWNSIKKSKINGALDFLVQPRGNIDADIMIIAQNPGGKGKTKYSTTWSDGNTSEFVIDASKKSNIYRQSWFTNLVPHPTIDNKISSNQISQCERLLIEQIDLIKPKVLIGFGNVVCDYLKSTYKSEFPIIEMQHPSYVKRFLKGKDNCINDWVDCMSQAKKYLEVR
jgi:hypothetical protein